MALLTVGVVAVAVAVAVVNVCLSNSWHNSIHFFKFILQQIAKSSKCFAAQNDFYIDLGDSQLLWLRIVQFKWFSHHWQPLLQVLLTKAFEVKAQEENKERVKAVIPRIELFKKSQNLKWIWVRLVVRRSKKHAEYEISLLIFAYRFRRYGNNKSLLENCFSYKNLLFSRSFLRQPYDKMVRS